MDLLATQPDPANAPQTPAQPNATTSSTSLPADQAAVPAVVHPDVPADSSANPVADIATQTSTADPVAAPATSNLPAMSDDAPVTPPALADLSTTPAVSEPELPTTSTETATPAPSDSSELTADDIMNKDLLDLMGMKDIKEEDRKALYEKVLKTVQYRVANRLAGLLSDEEFQEWEKLDQDGKQKFLDSKNIDAAAIYLEEVMAYKIEMVELMRVSQQAASANSSAQE